MTKITLNKSTVTNKLLQSAIELYIKIYSAPPYNETFYEEDVREEFLDYINNGLLIVYIIDPTTVVGFLAASLNLKCDEKINNQLKTNGINVSTDVYLSELGVHPDYRCKGLAKDMLIDFFDKYKDKSIYLRTAKYGNDKIIKYYEKFLFQQLPIVEKVENLRTDGKLEVDERIYMVKYPEPTNIQVTSCVHCH